MTFSEDEEESLTKTHDHAGFLVDCLERRLVPSKKKAKADKAETKTLKDVYHTVEIETMAHAEKLSAQLAAIFMKFLKDDKVDKTWARPSKEQLRACMQKVLEYRQRSISLHSEVQQEIFSRKMRFANANSALFNLGKSETEGERFARLQEFYSEFRSGASKLPVKKEQKAVIPFRDLSPPASPVVGRKSIVGRTFEAKAARTTLSWKERAMKSRCSAGGWKEFNFKTMASTSTAAGHVLPDWQEDSTYLMRSPEADHSAEVDITADVTESRSQSSRHSQRVSESGEKKKKVFDPTDAATMFPGLGLKRQPPETRRLLFPNITKTDNRDLPRSMQLDINRLPRHEVTGLLEDDIPSLPSASRKSSVSSEAIVCEDPLLSSLLPDHMLGEKQKDHFTNLVKKLIVSSDQEYTKECSNLWPPTGTDPVTDRIFDRTMRKGPEASSRPPLQSLPQRPRMSLSKSAPGLGLPPIHNKGSFPDPQRDCERGAASHVNSYLLKCSDSSIVPESLSFITGHSPNLEAAGRSLSDRDVTAMTSVLSGIAPVRALNLQDNSMLTDKSLVRFLDAVINQAGAADVQLQILNFQNNRSAGHATLLKIVDLLDGLASTRLRYLNVNGMHIGWKTQIPLCKAIGDHSGLTAVHLADTGLGGPHAADCIAKVINSATIQVLDLGWNCLTANVLAEMGKMLDGNVGLLSLSLANSSASSDKDSITPLVHFVERLSGNRGLTKLDVSLNRIDFRAALVLEDALAFHKKLAELNVSQNPLGVSGTRSLLRLLSGNESGLVHFNFEECIIDMEGNGTNNVQVFNSMMPGSSYKLDLSQPYHRSLLRMLCKSAESMKAQVSDLFTNVSFNPGSFTMPSKDGDGFWVVPTEGQLSMTFSLEKALGKTAKNPWKFSEVLKAHADAVRTRPGSRKAVHLLVQWRTIANNLSEQVVMLGALSKDFYLMPFHLKEFCRNREVAGQMICRLFSCIEGGQHSQFLALLLVPSFGEYVNTLKSVRSVLWFNADSPTGHYGFDLANPNDYAVADQLRLLDRWEGVLAVGQKRVDVSRRQNRSCFMNETYQQRPLQAESCTEWNMPTTGTFEFDYVTGKRVSEDTAPFGDEAFISVLTLLHHSKCLSRVQVEVLRMVSSYINLTCKQMRRLLGLFESSAVRSELFVLLYFNIVDICNEKIVRSAFEDAREYVRLKERFGHATLFPFIQPEQFTFKFDMQFNDQRHAALIIFKLMAAESESNLQEREYIKDKEAGPMDETNFWRAQKDVSLDTMPERGIFTGRYICAPEERDFKLRKKLMETYGFWQTSIAEKDVLWWASLFEAPGEVLEFLEWLLPRYQDLSLAFYDIDGSVPGESVSNGEITLKEFEGGFVALNCKKFAGPNEKQSIGTVFKFLDPTGEGTISKGEWEVLDLLWREIQLSIAEFINFLRRTCGSTIDEWWSVLDDDGSGEVTFKQWKNTCKDLGYFGATRQIFKFIDKDDEGKVERDEFETLKAFM